MTASQRYLLLLLAAVIAALAGGCAAAQPGSAYREVPVVFPHGAPMRGAVGSIVTALSRAMGAPPRSRG